VKDKEEGTESPNSHAIVEAGLDEIPPTSGFNSQMFQAKDVELPNSHVVVVVGSYEIPSTSSVDYEVPHLLTTEVNLFHVIFDLNKFLITKHSNKSAHISFSILD
jgi:hypothetical protein